MYYMLKDIDGYVRDIVQVPKQDYKMIYYPYALPQDVWNGYYKFEDNRFILDEEKKKEMGKDKDIQIKELQKQIFDLRGAIDELTNIILDN